MAQLIPDPEGTLLGQGGGGDEEEEAGLTWVNLSLSSFTKNRDDRGNLNGSGFVDSGSGVITMNAVAADDIQDLRDAAIMTAPLSSLATLLSVTEASIVDGTKMIMVRVSGINTTVPRYLAAGILLLDRDADLQGGAFGLGVGVARTSPTAKIAPSTVAHTSNASGTNVDLAVEDPWVVGTLTCSTNDAANNVEATSSIYGLDDNGVPRNLGQIIARQSTASMNVIDTWGICMYFEQSSGGAAGALTAKWEITAADSTMCAHKPS